MENRKKSIEQRFEFLLYINGHIIVQRYFNVLGYNDKVLDSMDLKWLYDDCVSMIQQNLKDKTDDYLWGRFNTYVKQEQEDVPKENIYDKEHTFSFEIKIDKESAIKGDFDGTIYPPAVRYQIDIKALIPEIVYKIRKTLGSKKITTNYGEVEL